MNEPNVRRIKKRARRRVGSGRWTGASYIRGKEGISGPLSGDGPGEGCALGKIDPRRAFAGFRRAWSPVRLRLQLWRIDAAWCLECTPIASLN